MGKGAQWILLVVLALSYSRANATSILAPQPFASGGITTGKLTRSYTQGHPSIQRAVFGDLSAAAVFWHWESDGSVTKVLFGCDRSWNRLIMSAEGEPLYAVGSPGAGADQFSHPTDVAVSTGGLVAVADPENNRVQVYAFYCLPPMFEVQHNLTPVATLLDPGWIRQPCEVEWDDNGTNLDPADDVLWVRQLDGMIVAGYHITSGTISRYCRIDVRAYGGLDQAASLVKGRRAVPGTPSSSTNSESLYVFDALSAKVAIYSVPRSIGQVSPPFGVGIFQGQVPVSGLAIADATADAWGSLYLLDAPRGRIVKVTGALSLVGEFGQAGTGPFPSGEMNAPRTAKLETIQCRAGAPAMFSAGITIAEQWADQSGIQTFAAILSAPDVTTSAEPGSLSWNISVASGDPCTASVTIQEAYTGADVRQLLLNGYLPAGAAQLQWDGRDASGALVPTCRPMRVAVTEHDSYGGAGGVSTVASFFYKPRAMVPLTITSNIPGAAILHNGGSKVVGGGGYTAACSLCVAQPISTAPTQSIDGVHYCFDTWSDGGERDHAVDMPTAKSIALGLVTTGAPSTTYGDDVELPTDLTDCRIKIFSGIANARNGLTIYPGTILRFSRVNARPGNLLTWKYLTATDAVFESTDSTESNVPAGAWLGLDMADPNGGTITLSGCTIRNASTGVGSTSLHGGHVTSVAIDNCGFTKNVTDVDLDFLNGTAAGKSAHLAHNFFSAKTGVRIEGADQAGDSYVAASIDSNTFSGSQSNTVQLRLTGGFSGHLYKNTVALVAAGTRGVDLVAVGGNFPNVILQDNVFQNASGRTALSAPVVLSPYTITAVNNYWSLFSHQEIEDVVYHNADASNRAAVTFEPWLTGGGAGGHGCPYVLTERNGEYVVENSILGRGEYRTTVGQPVWDAVEVKAGKADASGVARIRIREMESDTDVLDQVRLVAIQVPEGVSLATDATGSLTAFREVGTLSQVRGWTGRNTPFISPIAPTSAYRGEPGDSLEFEVGAPGGIVIGRRIAISLIPKPTAMGIGDKLGVTVRVSRDDLGSQWETVGEVIPKENWSTSLLPKEAVASSPIRRVRVIWNTPHTLGWAGLVEAVPMTERDLRVVAATHSNGGDALGAVTKSDDQSAILKGHEHVELAYDASNLRPDDRVVVMARGYYTGSGAASEVAIPLRVFVSQNRPNPFNPRTEIAFGLPVKGSVSVRVFDVSGRLVRVLENREFPAGYHTTVWDGRNQSGHPVASGVYFYQAELPNQTVRRRMVLLK